MKRRISETRLTLGVAILFATGCSLVYDTNDLRHQDGGVSDTGTTDTGARDTAADDSGTGDSGTGDSGTGDSGTGDSGTGDTSTGDSGTGDSGIVDSGPPPCASPMPTGVTWDDHGNATVAFDTMSSSSMTYELDLGGDITRFTLPSDSTSATIDGYFIPLVHSMDTLTIRRTDGSCALDVTVGTTMDLVPKPTGTSSLRASHTAAMDIANNGTVVFFQQPAGLMGDDLDIWPLGGALPQNLVRTAGTSSPRDWGAGPRISDDGALIVYWRGDYDSAAPAPGQFFYIYFDGTGTRHNGQIDLGTAFVTSDLRAPAGAGGPYSFTLRRADGNAQLVRFTEMQLRMSLMSDPFDLGFAGAGPSLVPVDATGAGWLAYLEPGATDDAYSPRRVAVTNLGVVAGTTSPPTGCTANRKHTTTAIGESASVRGQIAFVGLCGSSTTPQLHVGDPTALNFSTTGANHYDIPSGADGLLAADDTLRHFLLRRTPTSTTSGQLYLLSLDDGAFVFVDEDVTPVPILTTLFDSAAMSPDGHWAVYPTHSSGAAGSPVGFDLVRIRVY